MGSGFSKMKKQARLFEQRLESARSALKIKQATGVSGNGLVTVVVNGEKELLSIAIKPECVDAADVEGLQDLIKAACENAYSQLQDSDEMSLDSLLNG